MAYDDDDCFITINSGLVPLIEGLCAQILYSIIRHFKATSCIYKRKILHQITNSFIIFPWCADSESFLGTNLVQTVF